MLINGEGSLHHAPRIATEFFPYIMNLIPRRKPIALINALWQDMYYPGIESDLEKIKLISLRESLSYENFIKSYHHYNIRITPDLIFNNQFTTISKIGYSDSVTQKIRNTFKRMKNYMPLNFIDTGTYAKPESLTYPSLEAYILWLKSLDLFVTGRFHGVCLSVLAGTPFLAYSSNSHKIEGILKDMGVPELLIKERREEIKKIELAKESFPKTQAYIVQAKEKIVELFREIANL
jgi:exopolysaccharide biosynthesis predicted pyruvyltransferase EpsI